MIVRIAGFEVRYLLRNPLTWLAGAAIFSMVFMSMNAPGFELGSQGGLLRNAAYATLRNALSCSVMLMLVTTSFVANAVLRDDETGYGAIIRSTPITGPQYVLGRFLGAFAVAALCALVVPLATWSGSLMPWADPATLGPNRVADHLFATFVILLPNLLTHSAILFALATITRSMMATYLGVIGLLSAFFSLQNALDGPHVETIVAILEPFGGRALRDAVRYWTLPELNAELPELAGTLLHNRLLWMGISIACLALTCAVHRAGDRGSAKRERKRRRAQAAEPRPALAMPRLPQPQHGGAALRALLWMRTRFEVKQVVLSPAFPVLMAWGMSYTLMALTTQGSGFSPQYPTTLTLIPEIEDAFRVVMMVVAIYYAGEVVWRERDRRVHELVDAAPVPNWAHVIPKTAALTLVLVSILLVNVAASIGLQLSRGFTDIEPGKYLLFYVLPSSFDMLLLAAVSMFVQSLSPHKTIGWGVMVLFLAFKESGAFVQHNLLLYGGTPSVPFSDLAGAASFWKGAWTFRAYWGAFALLLLLAAHLLWRRGTEVRLKPRVALLRRRLAGGAGWVAVAALATFVATGAWAYYNTNVLNEYVTAEDLEERAVEREKRSGGYRGVPQPSLEELHLEIDIHPKERQALTKGRYLLSNRTGQPIPELHVRVLDDALELVSADVQNGRLTVDDEEFGHRIYRLDPPLPPGAEMVMTFRTRRRHRGFLNGSQPTDLVENGTFLTELQLVPSLGVNEAGLIRDPETRRKHGLPEFPEPPKLEDLSAARRQSFGNGWSRACDITVSTDASQTPIAPGRKISDVTREGRRTARFVTDTPIRARFSVQSARYAERHRRHGGVDLAVFHHPRHHWNVDRMLDAMAASLDCYQEAFGPYQFDHVRIVEFPAYHGYAQAFAGTIPFSESVGFLADYGNPETMDSVTGMTAHELAHQYWPHQMMPAETEGYTLLVETLAQHSAQLVLKRLGREDQVRRYLQYELDGYLYGRAAETGKEPPLMRVLGQDWLSYRKGAMAMYLLQLRLGEEAVNRALRTMLARYKFQGAPYPRSLELIAALRAEAKTPEDQALITDLFERVTIYDLQVLSPSAVRRPDGTWSVTVPVSAKKFYADDGPEIEAPLDERIEIGLFSAAPGLLAFSREDVIVMERRPLRTGMQSFELVTDREPLYAGVDPFNFHVDRNSADNVAAVSR